MGESRQEQKMKIGRNLLNVLGVFFLCILFVGINACGDGANEDNKKDAAPFFDESGGPIAKPIPAPAPTDFDDPITTPTPRPRPENSDDRHERARNNDRNRDDDREEDGGECLINRDCVAEHGVGAHCEQGTCFKSDGDRAHDEAEEDDSRNGIVWQEAKKLTADNQEQASSVKFAFNGRGNAIVVWEQLLARDHKLWGGVLKKGETSLTQVKLLDQGISSFNMAANQNGKAVVVWTKRANDKDGLYCDVFNNGERDEWSGTMTIHNMAHSIASPQVAVYPNGNFIVTWADVVADYRMRGRYYNGQEKRWSAIYNIGSNLAGGQHDPVLVIDNSTGKALVVWSQEVWNDGNRMIRRDIVASRYSPAAQAWEDAVPIENQEASSVFPRAHVIDGKVMMLWTQLNGDGFKSIYTSTYDFENGQIAEAYKISDYDTYYDFAVNAEGNGMLVSTRNDGGNGESIHRKTYEHAEDTFSVDDYIIAHSEGRGTRPRVIMNDTGNAMVIWSHTVSAGQRQQRLAAKYYQQEDGTWDELKIVDGEGTGIQSPVFEFDSAGNGLSLWIQKNNIGNPQSLWMSRFE